MLIGLCIFCIIIALIVMSCIKVGSNYEREIEAVWDREKKKEGNYDSLSPDW